MARLISSSSDTAVDVLEHEPHALAAAHEIVHLEDVRVIQLGQEPRLALQRGGER
ncbi:MAG: hypothetical protein WDO74_00220 [Pseudomonadota bacterium]